MCCQIWADVISSVGSVGMVSLGRWGEREGRGGELTVIRDGHCFFHLNGLVESVKADGGGYAAAFLDR